MNSELGMILPFAFVMFVVWNGTRIILARTRNPRAPAAGNEQLLMDLARRVQQIEEALEATAKDVQHLREAERFTAQLLSSRATLTSAELAEPTHR